MSNRVEERISSTVGCLVVIGIAILLVMLSRHVELVPYKAPPEPERETTVPSGDEERCETADTCVADTTVENQDEPSPLENQAAEHATVLDCEPQLPLSTEGAALKEGSSMPTCQEESSQEPTYRARLFRRLRRR